MSKESSSSPHTGKAFKVLSNNIQDFDLKS